MAIAVYIVDDHKIFRQGIGSLIGSEDDMEVISYAGSVQEFTEDIKNHQPDVILMDITMKDGVGTDATTWYKKQDFGTAKVLILSMHREEKYVKNVLEAGADGFLLKDAGTREMLNAIRQVYEGEQFYSPEILQSIVKQLTTKNASKKTIAGEKLSKRETEVLRLIADEYSNQEIADALFISIRTVDTHRRNMLEKLQLRNTAGLVKYAIRNGLADV